MQNVTIYLFSALSKNLMQSGKTRIATNASPLIEEVLEPTAPMANMCFSFSLSLAEYLSVSNSRRLNRVICVCVSHLKFVENIVKEGTPKIAV